MTKFTYPAVIYKDEDGSYLIVMYDLKLVSSGNTMEEAVSNIKEFFNAYIECALAFETEIPEPTQYEDVVMIYSNQQIMLLDCIINEKNKAI